MAASGDVKSLLLELDASVELLRRGLTRGDQAVQEFERDTRARLDRTDRRFEQLGGGLRQLPGAIGRARAEIATIGTTVERVEGQVRASTNVMRSALLASTAALTAAFSVDRVKEYADSYTRFTNSLATAGIEGQRLAKTQEGVYAVAQRNGVQLEALGSLYGNIASLQKDLNASDEDTLKVSSAVAAALKIKGASAEQAAGAILGLTQALGNGKFQAEEFNQINDGARPLLQAAADASDKYRGSLGKLRQDVLAGTVTSKDLFAMIVNGSAALESKAAKANLTIGASFTILNNALGKYIGETGEASGATLRVGQAIVTLADNLDTIVPALTIIGVAFAANRVATSRFVAEFVAGTGGAGASARIFAQQVAAGNVAMVGTVGAAAARAQALAASAAADVASIEQTIAARRAEQAVLAQTIAEERALAAERRAIAANAAAQNVGGGNRTVLLAAQRRAENDATFATQRLAAARQRLAVVDGELAVAEGSLAGAQARAATASNVATAATARATLAAQAGAAASRLFAGTLTLIGGSVAGGAAILVLGALVAAVIHYRNEAAETTRRNDEYAASGKRVNAVLAETATLGRSAAGAITSVGSTAATSAGQMLTFAGAVGEAAEKLRQLAVARRNEALGKLQAEYSDARRRERESVAAFEARQPSAAGLARGTGFLSPADRDANRRDLTQAAAARSQADAVRREYFRVRGVPLEGLLTGSERNNGRDVEGELARVTRDLVVARQRGVRSTVESLEAQKFELTQYKDYRKKGLSPQAAQEAAASDAAAFRNASAGARGDRDAKAGTRARTKADAAAAAAARKEVAQVRDAAADERAFSAAERQVNNEIAAARADLSGSATERAQIERDRIEAERINRANEIEQQAKQGGLGEGDVAATRKLELQRLNDRRAALETEVIDAREQQRVADEALALAQADRSNQTELLQKQADLVTSAGQRRDLELRILSIQYDEERAKLEGVIASRDATEAEKKIAARRLALLGQLQGADTAAVERRNAGAVDQYREGLRASVEDMGEALEQVEANGLANLEDGLLGIVTGTETAASAFKKMAASIIADLARIAIQKAILAAVGAATGGGSGSVAISNANINNGGLIDLSFGGGRATGGPVDASKWYVVGEKGPELFAPGVSGTVVPNERLQAPRAPNLRALSGGSGPGVAVMLRVALSEDLHATIDNRAAGVAVQVVRAAAPEIVSAATANTLAEAGRPRM